MVTLVPRRHFLPTRDQRAFTGRGATVLLLDNGIDEASLLGPNFICLSGFRGGSHGAHSFRVASIAGDPQPCDDPAGIAPDAKYFSFDHRLIKPGEFVECLKKIQHCIGHIDVISVAWSAPATLKLATEGNSWAAELSRQGTLIVAAAGHDGIGRVRLPALWTDALAVGVHDGTCRPTTFCSHSEAFGKPELFVENVALAARDKTGDVGVMRGTSAAVGVVSGLAALHVEWLEQVGRDPFPGLLKARILAATRSMTEGTSRALSPELSFSGPSCFYAVNDPTSADHSYYVEKAPGAPCCVAVVTTSQSTKSLFLSGLSRLEIEIEALGERRCFSSKVAHLVADVPESWGGLVRVKVRAWGAQAFAAIAFQGATEKRAASRQSAKRELLTLGISASHHASACVLEGHEVKRAVQLERLSRTKADGQPFLGSEAAPRYCLDSLGIRPSDIATFAYNSQPVLPGWTGLSRPLAADHFALFDPYGEDAVFVSHHLAHAFAAYAASPFDTAVIVVADGSGGGIVGSEQDLLLQGPEMRAYLEREPTTLPGIHVTSIYTFDPEGFQLIDREYAASFNPRCGSSSLGETYASVSQYIFGSWLDGGKLMGLAPYGDRKAHPSLLRRDESGQLVFGSAWKLSHADLTGREPLHYRELAARIQADVEEALLDRARSAVQKSGRGNLIFTGGLSLNCVANERIRRESGCAEAFFFPAASDAGICVGAAHAAVYRRTGATRAQRATRWSDFLGHPYDDRDYEVSLEEARCAVVCEPLSIPRLARGLAQGWVVAWFEGGSEFGPRSLGHRSILASPRTRETWNFINRRVKRREDFRPFAPIVNEEDAATYFELDEPSPYMLRVVQIREPYREFLGAVCHVDGSARVQTVGPTSGTRLHELLLEMKALSHPPVLLNTSLNVGGEPIVETPSEAIRLLLTTPIDALVLADRVVRRKSPPNKLLSARSILALSPGTRLKEVIETSSRVLTIESELSRGSFLLTSSQYRTLTALNGESSLEEALSGGGHREVDESAPPLLTALWSHGLLLYLGEAVV